MDSGQHPDSRHHSEDEDHKSPSLLVDSSGQRYRKHIYNRLGLFIIIFILDHSGIIKASLTIPTSTFALNLDDNDIPFIEDSANTVIEGSKHQMTIGTSSKSVFKFPNIDIVHCSRIGAKQTYSQLQLQT